MLRASEQQHTKGHSHRSLPYGYIAIFIVALIVLYYGITSGAGNLMNKTKSDSGEGNVHIRGGINSLSSKKALADMNPEEQLKLKQLMARTHAFGQGAFGRGGGGGFSGFSGMNGMKNMMMGNGNGNDDTDMGAASIYVYKQSPIVALENEEDVGLRSVTLIWLHGAAFTTSDWLELGFFAELAVQGYISYSVDIPGYGKSKNVHAEHNPDWLIRVINEIMNNEENDKFVLISPSMSGAYTLPILVDKTQQYKADLKDNTLAGFIAIAPVMSGEYTDVEYGNVNIPVCIVYGENDEALGVRSKENLQQIKTHKIVMIPDGNHAAYLSNPELFLQQITSYLNEFFD